MLDKPIFFIGMPRSGTTVVFEAFASSPSFGWLSNYSEMWPAYPSINLLCALLDNPVVKLRGNKKQYGNVVFGNRYLPQPVEAYNFWDMYSGRNFSRSFLSNIKANDDEAKKLQHAVAKVMRFQMKKRFVTKLTGPGRIEYLSSVFDDAIFVNVVRDGRAVVHSLLNVGFWKNKGGFDGPFWEGGLGEPEIEIWEQYEKGPAVLCALQWRSIMENISLESAHLNESRFFTIRYEDYISAPDETLSKIYDLTDCAQIGNNVISAEPTAPMVNMNDKYLRDFSKDRIEAITEIMSPILAKYGYLESQGD